MHKFQKVFCSMLLSLAVSLPILGSTATGPYTIRNIQVTGNHIMDQEVIISLSGLKQGASIDISPHSRQVPVAIRKITENPSIQYVSIYLADIEPKDGTATVLIKVKEYSHLTDYAIVGIKQKEKKTC